MMFLGIFINFLAKYRLKSNEDNFNVKYWFKDNWPELLQSTLFSTAIVFLFVHPDTTVNPEELYKWLQRFLPLPEGVIFPMNLFIPFIIGLTINNIVYWYNKKKEKWSIKKLKKDD